MSTISQLRTAPARPHLARDSVVSNESMMSTPTDPDREALLRNLVLIGVTLIEASAIFGWLWLHTHGEPWWGLGVLVLGEAVETAAFRFFTGRAHERWGPLDPSLAAQKHNSRLRWRLGMAGNLEVAIWVVWLASAERIDQPDVAGVLVWPTLLLLVLMHLKHHFEAATVCDFRLRSGLFNVRRALASALEVGGAVICLALLYHDRPVLAAAVLFAGILGEHATQIQALRWEMSARDIRVPRDQRFKPPVRGLGGPLKALTDAVWFWRLVESIGPLHAWVNRRIISSAASTMDPRPNPLSTMADYTSWTSLTDRTRSARHLPPAQPATTEAGPPSVDAVTELFRRSGPTIECPKSTVLFTFFAQWFTDGFLRTKRPEKIVPPPPPNDAPTRDTTWSESTQEIDLVQLYGRAPEATAQLRGEHGLLKFQTVNGEEYPPYLCNAFGQIRAEFDELHVPIGFDEMPLEHKTKLFASGTDVHNLGSVTLNVLFFREHNRIARQLGAEYPRWEEERVFQTARNVLIVLLLKIAVEEYINHITPDVYRFRVAPASFAKESWYRSNWVAIEFNLLYRWHSMVPSTFCLDGTALPLEAVLSDNSILTGTGLGRLMAAASGQPAGRIGLFNTPELLVDRAERASIKQARKARLASFNDYRRACRHVPAMRFDEISDVEPVQDALAELYGHPEDVEFYVGLFAESTDHNRVLPRLMTTMVACDAFSQAMTNPLLAPRVFNEATFSPAGMEIIKQTATLADLVERNVPAGSDPYFISLTRRDWRRQ